MKFLKTLLLSVGFFIFLTACSEKLPTLFNSDKIVAFGDSLTYGYNVAPEHSYPEQLKKMTGYRIINEGLSGDTATLGKKRLQDVVEYHNPSAVILSIGGSDLLAGVTKNLEDDLTWMLQYLKSKDIIVIILSEPQPSFLSKTMGLKDADVYKKVANKEDVFLLDNIFSKYLSDDSLKIDLVHLNEKGYELVAQDIAKRLKKAGLFM